MQIFYVHGLSGNTCVKDVKKDADTLVTGANASVYEDIRQAEKIFYTLPSPLESAMLIKSAGALFDDNLLNPIDR